MKWSDVPAGQYKAQLKDWGLEEVEKLGGLLKAVLVFDVFVGEEIASGKWEGFLETKEGKPNGKTLKTLVTCGFASDEIFDLATKGDALDNSRTYDVTISKEAGAFGQVYTRIEWVNLPGSGVGIKKAVPKKKSSAAFKAALSKARSEVGAAKQAPRDPIDDLGF